MAAVHTGSIMNMILCLFAFQLVLATSSQNEARPRFVLSRPSPWEEFISDPAQQNLTTLERFFVNYQNKLDEIILDHDIDQHTRMHIARLLVSAGADLREAVIKGLSPRELNFRDERSYFEYFSDVILEMGSLLDNSVRGQQPGQTLYRCLNYFSRDREYFFEAFHLIANFEPFAPLESEISLLFPMLKCDKDVDSKKRFLQTYLDHPNNFPVFNCLLVFAWSQNFHHTLLDGHELVPTTDHWFEPVKPCLFAGKLAEAVSYILQCRRMGASLSESLVWTTSTRGRSRPVFKSKPVLKFVTEELPAKYHDLIAVLIIPDGFPRNRQGEPLDKDLNDSESVYNTYGLRDVDVPYGYGSYRDLIMMARHIRSNYVGLIESMMDMSGMQPSSHLQEIISILMTIIASETGQ